MTHGFTAWIKSTLLGDVSNFSTTAHQTRTNRDFDLHSSEDRSFGRTYCGPETVNAPSFKVLATLQRLNIFAKIWTALRSIGEYDVARTR